MHGLEGKPPPASWIMDMRNSTHKLNTPSKQQQGDKAAIYWNKTEMICAYTDALSTYQRVCDVLGRHGRKSYTSYIQVGYA